MQDERACVAGVAQELHVERVVEAAATRGDDRAVLADVLRMGQDERVAEQGKRLAQGLALSGELARADQVGGVEDDFEVLGSQLVEQPPARGGVGDDVVVLGLEGEDDVVPLG